MLTIVLNDAQEIHKEIHIIKTSLPQNMHYEFYGYGLVLGSGRGRLRVLLMLGLGL